MNNRFLTTRERRTIVLMILPIGLIAVAAWWVQQRHQRELWAKTPLKVRVQSVRRVPVTPRDVAAGYDTRYEVLLSGQNRPILPTDEQAAWSGSNFHVMNAKTEKIIGGKAGEVGWGNMDYDIQQNAIRAHFIFALASVPRSNGALLFDAIMQADRYNAKLRGTTHIYEIPLKFEVRKPNEIIKVPRISHHTRLYAPKISVVRGGTSPNITYDVTATFKSLEPVQPLSRKSMLRPLATYLEDERGWHYKIRVGSGSFNGVDSHSIHWILDPGTYPNKARRLTLHSQVGIAEEWPVPLKIVMWDHPLPKTPKAKQVAKR